MGKTGILRLINPAPTHVLAKYSPGAECELREQEGLLAVHARDGEDDLSGFQVSVTPLNAPDWSKIKSSFCPPSF